MHNSSMNRSTTLLPRSFISTAKSKQPIGCSVMSRKQTTIFIQDNVNEYLYKIMLIYTTIFIQYFAQSRKRADAPNLLSLSQKLSKENELVYTP